MEFDLSLDVPETFNMASVLVDRHVAEGRGSRVAIHYQDDSITYADLLKRVNKAGNMLRDQGIEIEDRVLILTTDRPEFIESFVGAMKIGAVPVPINTLSERDDLAYYIEDSRAAAVIADDQFLRRLEGFPGTFRYLKRVFVLPDADSSQTSASIAKSLGPRAAELSYRDAFAAASDELEVEPTSRDDPSYWLYSSGTTGPAKGTVHLHQDMVYCTSTWLREVSKPTPDDRNFTASKLFTSYGLVNGLYQPLMACNATVLMPGPPTTQAVVDTIARYRPTIFFTVPALYNNILNDHAAGKLQVDLSSVRLCISAGDALPPVIYDRWLETFGIELLDGIGSTEFGYIYIQNLPGRARPGSSGQLLPGYNAKILDEDGHPVPQGEVGELYVQSPSFAFAYWKKRDRSRDTFRGPWLKTGDLYTLDADGYYHYEGRADDMFKVNAQWVSPIEVEGVLLRHPSVAEVAVVPYKQADGRIKPRAHVVLRDGSAGGSELADALVRFCAEGLDRDHLYKCPQEIRFESDPLPKTASGKIQRHKLRQR
ncbi:MAG TPA: benzoate-CoA ligase family protein [Chloroflexota bacterium]|nr:benzoate-CoA ligase family protein [Chloroflexota bacterium]